MERRFQCTACGKCCYGWLPLTVADAVRHAGRFPFAMIWMTIRQGTRNFAITERLGTSISLGKRGRLALRVGPVAYIPASFACPELTAEGQCAIHTDKPIRCQTMPFSAYREERDQGELLVPKDGWACDTSDAAPVVYRDKNAVCRDAFDTERRQLLDQSALIRAYADGLIGRAPNLMAGIEQAARKPRGGYVVLGFSGILSRIDGFDTGAFAERQLPVLQDFAERTADNKDLSDYHRHYTDAAKAMRRFLERS